jgi:ketosteroid isomerase-like protein
MVHQENQEGEKMSEDLQNEFQRLGDEWSRSIVSNDVEAIGRFMADDWVIVGDSGITERDSFLALVASGDLTHEMMEGEVKRVRTYGNVAIVNARGRNNGHYKGQAFTADEWITDVFIKRDGRWQCVLTHLTAAIDR